MEHLAPSLAGHVHYVSTASFAMLRSLSGPLGPGTQCHGRQGVNAMNADFARSTKTEMKLTKLEQSLRIQARGHAMELRALIISNYGFLFNYELCMNF